MTAIGTPPRGGHRRPGSGTAGRDLLCVLGAALVAALIAMLLAPLGSTTIYVIAGLVAAGAVLHAVRGELLPPLRQAVDRARPSHRSRRRAPRPSPVRFATVVLVLLAIAFVTVGTAAHGLLVAGAVIGLVGLVVSGWVCWPLLHHLATVLPEAPRRRIPTSHTASPGKPRSSRPAAPYRGRRQPAARAVGGTLVVLATGVMAFLLAGVGLLGVIAASGAITLVVLLCCVRNRSVFFTFLSVVSLVLLLHKSIGPEDLQESGGAVAIYVTTFDAMIVVLYGLWIHEGTFVADARAALQHRRILLLPLIGVLFLLPSALVAPSADHVASELFRMGWMYLLFFYAAVRIRTRQHVWAVLAGFGVFAFLEFVVVVLQWRTGGVLGLSFLGVPTSLTQRVTDVDSIGRPFGTIIHPVFMGAVMGSLALVALGLAISLRRSLTKVVATAMIGVCTIPLYLSHTRASLLAALIAAIYVVGAGLARDQLQWSTLRRIGLSVLVAVAVFWPQLSAKFSEDFGTGHFWEEVQSRLQLNGIALNMINDHWGLGVGLNNFEIVLPRYESHFVIFANNPVHNVYLLYFAETGIIGLLGFLLVCVGMLRAAAVAARSHDRLLGGVPVGVVGVMIFLGLEELLGFSVRQDVPLAVYWLLAGLALACHSIAPAGPPVAGGTPHRASYPPNRAARDAHVGRRAASPSHASPSHASPNHAAARSAPPAARANSHGRAARERRAVLRARVGSRGWVAGGLALAVLVLGQAAVTTPSGAAPTDARIVFAAVIRNTAQQAVYTVRPDGSGITRVTPDDGRIYSWPRWAFDNHKIVYTALSSGPAGPVDSIELVNPDGSDRQVISSFDYVVSQPLIDRTGRWMYFSAFAPWFIRVALFRMDLSTLQSINLTARTNPRAGVDADPVITPDQRHLLAITGARHRADVDEISTDGMVRSTVVDDGTYNTDPDVSPDGSHLTVSSYRGSGTPRLINGNGIDITKSYGFVLAVHPLHGGAEQVLTRGGNCAARTAAHSCSVPDMSAFLPRYFDGGRDIAFTGALNNRTTCICALAADGTAPRVIVFSTALAIRWFTFPQTGATADRLGDLGADAPRSRVLLTAATTHSSRAVLYDASPDLMHRTELALPRGLSPVQARWSLDRSRIVFTARVPIPAHQAAPHPAAPPGARRREHVTLSDVNALSIALRTTTQRPRSLAEEQVFLRNADGSVRQLTDPWIEDWQDGVRLGDARANTDPSFTPDGRAVLVTNTSTLTGESFLLRIDLRSGQVTNLTNATSGALPVADATPAVSPDGSTIAFATAVGRYSDLFTMDARTGRSIREVTATDAPDDEPAWLPGGTTLVSVTARGGTRIIVGTNLRTRAQTLLSTTDQGSASDPVPDPTGTDVLFVGASVTGSSVYTVPSGGGRSPVLLQPDIVHQFRYVDWK